MTFDEYIAARNEVIDPERRYNVYRHVANRLRERYSLPRHEWSLDLWQKISYACATRQMPVLHRTKEAVFFQSEFLGHQVIWVYSKLLRCVVTVYPPDHNIFHFHYREEMRKMRA